MSKSDPDSAIFMEDAAEVGLDRCKKSPVWSPGSRYSLQILLLAGGCFPACCKLSRPSPSHSAVAKDAATLGRC